MMWTQPNFGLQCFISTMAAMRCAEGPLGASGRSPAKVLSMIRRQGRVHGRRRAWRGRWDSSERRLVWGGCWTGRPEFAHGGKQRFDSFASENEERGHRLQTSG